MFTSSASASVIHSTERSQIDARGSASPAPGAYNIAQDLLLVSYFNLVFVTAFCCITKCSNPLQPMNQVASAFKSSATRFKEKKQDGIPVGPGELRE